MANKFFRDVFQLQNVFSTFGDRLMDLTKCSTEVEQERLQGSDFVNILEGRLTIK